MSGCPMGFPFSPLVSNLVMEDVEKQALSKFSFKSTVYKLYVDDILTIVPTDKIIELLNVLNSIEQPIQFTLQIKKIIL